MNPGTTVFIIVGIVGLLLYALKALKYEPEESFITAMNVNASSENTTPDIVRAIENVGKPHTISDHQGSVLNKTDDSGYNKIQKTAMEKMVNCPPMPDMSLYIRKDQIPCWNCSLK